MKFVIRFYIFITLLLLAKLAFAAQEAAIITDGAMIYKKADFDSSVIGYMRSGQEVEISNKTFGPFYRIRFKQGVLGYISDVDVAPKGGRRNGFKTSANQKINKSFITKKYFGITLGNFNFSEDYNISGTKTQVTQALMFYGLKLTEPIKYLSGPFVFDSELFYHSGIPSYYTSGNNVGNSGRILILDAEVLYSLFESRNRRYWFYAGAGPGLSYSSFSVSVSGAATNLTQVQFGGVITGGVAIKMNKFTIKFEPKYFIFQTAYFGIVGAAQFEF